MNLKLIHKLITILLIFTLGCQQEDAGKFNLWEATIAEGTLLKIAFACEQETRHRRPPEGFSEL